MKNKLTELRKEFPLLKGVRIIDCTTELLSGILSRDADMQGLFSLALIALWHWQIRHRLKD